MNFAALEQIQLKVEAGEPLTEPEVRALQSAALAEPGPKWRLVIAHALINVERADAALPMMEALVQEAPGHPQTRLGLARALIALDRYGDAEQQLQRVLQERPGDPEAMKGLAVLALRRGERERARKLVTDALKIDPFDQEAQLIAAELDPSSKSAADLPPPVAIASERAFLEALLTELKSQGVSHVRRGGHLFLKSGGHVGRVDVRGLYDSYVSETKPLADVVREIARQLGANTEETLGREELLAKVRPVLRPSDFDEKAKGALWLELSDELKIFYVVDDPELIRYVPEGLARRAGIPAALLHELALTHLAKDEVELRRVRVDEGDIVPASADAPFVALLNGDGYDGARLLLPAVREKLLAALHTTDIRVFLGRREAVVACSAADEQAVKALSRLPATDGVAGQFTLSPDGLLKRVT